MRALLLALILVAPRPVDALCIRSFEHPVVINPGAEVPTDGGIVVVTQIGGDGEDTGEALQPTWVWKSTDAEEKPTTTALAPGMVLYKAPKAAGELTDGKKTRAKIKLATVAPAALAAPKIKSVSHATQKGPRGSSTWVTVRFHEAPADTLAIIIYAGKTARSFAQIGEGATEAQVYSQGKCSALPNGTVESRAGEKVTFRWVDRFGRLSPPSKVVVISRGKVPT